MHTTLTVIQHIKDSEFNTVEYKMSYSIEIKTLDELWASLLVGSKELLNDGTKFVNFDEIMEFYNSDPIRTLPTSLNSRESLNQLVYYYLGVGSKQSVNDAVILSNILFNIVFLEYAMVCKQKNERSVTFANVVEHFRTRVKQIHEEEYKNTQTNNINPNVADGYHHLDKDKLYELTMSKEAPSRLFKQYQTAYSAQESFKQKVQHVRQNRNRIYTRSLDDNSYSSQVKQFSYDSGGTKKEGEWYGDTLLISTVPTIQQTNVRMIVIGHAASTIAIFFFLLIYIKICRRAFIVDLQRRSSKN